ncbi:MmgE/PrpD family protein [Aeromicrobium sp. CF4.19]|uniref:MmgE/PrpD family protein n=1 Tax=Aeromicrobium sp. CF4.19 TaxID=3373082 RepID=UPI003EE7EE7A
MAAARDPEGLSRLNDHPITLVLAGSAVGSRRTPLPDAAYEAATAAFTDWIGVTIGGSATPPARMLTAALAGSDDHSQVVGTTLRAQAPTAALINGTAAHALELDDIYSPGTYHPGAPTIAAALAVAQAAGTGGESLLRAIVVGYEIGNRVAQVLGPDHYKAWHTTGTVGSIGAAAAVAEVLQLDERASANALAVAATMGAGLQQTLRSDSMGKPLHSGHAAHAGVVAGLAAAEGFTGTLDVLDGEIGMGVAMSSAPDWAAAARPFGPAFLVEQTTVKPYPCCGHTFAAIDASIDLSNRGLSLGDIARVEVHTYTAAIDVAGNPAPRTPYEAKFSIPFVVACALSDGVVDASSFRDGKLHDADIQRLMARVVMRPDPTFVDAFPDRRGARVDALDMHGGHLSGSVVADRRGDPSNPVSPVQMSQKFSGLVGPILGPDCGSELAVQLRSMKAMPDVRTLRLGPGTD